MAFSADQFLSNSINKRKEQNSFRQLTNPAGLIDFCSNDYLGFARSEKLNAEIEKQFKALQRYFNGSGGSRLLAGNTMYAEELENKIAAFHKAEAGLIYNSGYDANVGLFSSIGQKDTCIIYDELIHASVHDGIKMSSASAYMFRHNDLFHLEERLKAAQGFTYVAVESIYSMDGDEALLKEILDLCKKYNANLIVDEAHSTGVSGLHGEGLVKKYQMEKEVFARVHTFGKALGCHGAVILGSLLLRDYLINFSRAFIYTTALPLHSLVAINCSYENLKSLSSDQNALPELIDYFKNEVSKFSQLQIIPSNSPIQCIVVPGNLKVKQLAVMLQESGFDIRPIVSPTVSKGKERLRICLHLFNSKEEIRLLIKSINSHLQTING